MRNSEKDVEYFDKRIAFREKLIDEKLPVAEAFPRIEGRPGNASSLCMYTFQTCVLRYGRGDAIEAISPSVWRWVEAKEIEKRIISQIPPERSNEKVMHERVTLDTVYDALTMMAFARALNFSPAEMSRLFGAIGYPGEDALIDEAARALGDAQRPVAQACKFPKVYDPLLEVWRCDPAERPAKLLAFSKVWKKKIKPIYWSDSLNGADGAYFGYWCFDVALAAIALDIPDEALRDNPYYPKDLVDAARAK
ncbi:hypothetical protein C8246_11585 [Paracidovorax avenae]|uniref:PoNe immunity protein domain-containing protein n=1 Tax=Paracidovorax avenae TaxID=80867 RepID=UPI000D220ADF|nr:PoNe immunity protein domain-containing protein [Paracidovorax avenae]AVS92317.1 hypothetical protein C8246_11585 [Paracidovorax avenae]AVS95036.1 hypothetical protein C8232_01205 [Paracidovorax avenae]AVT08594.1 hypothetical protein C8242_03065 [Paracidovorax avenae]